MSKPQEPFVRDAIPMDAAAICAIYNTAIRERTSTFETDPREAEEFGGRIAAERFPLLVAENGGEVAGWAGAAAYSPRSCYAGIAECSVYVKAEERGRGIGTALTEALALAAWDAEFHKLLGKLFTDNLASIRLVERCGFQSVGVHRRHGQLDGDWRDVLLVERLREPGAASTAAPILPQRRR